jgi:hypothetical protein
MPRPGRSPRHGAHRAGTVSVGAYVPARVRDVLRARAAARGDTLAAYVRALLVRHAEAGDDAPPTDPTPYVKTGDPASK